MRSYNPQDIRETRLKSAAARAMQQVQAEKAAAPEGFAERSRQSTEQARRFQERARAGKGIR